MFYPEYEEASHRHLKACKYLKESLGQITRNEDRERVLGEIYYLSGYVVECIFKYAIFNIIEYDKEKKIDFRERHHPEFETIKQIKTHELDELANLIEKSDFQGKEDIPFIGYELPNNEDILFRSWGPYFRYSLKGNIKHLITNLDSLMTYIELVEQIQTSIKSNIIK